MQRKVKAFLVRTFKLSDAKSLAELFHGSVHAAAASDYSPEQLAVWSPAVPAADSYLNRAGKDSVFVAEDANGTPAGYGIITPTGHIDHLYCRADMMRMGIGSALYAVMEEASLKTGARTLTVDASEAARHFFERQGFELQFRRDFTLCGVSIYNYRMSKALGTNR